MSALYQCPGCGHTHRERSDRPAPRCREPIHLLEPRADYPHMIAVAMIPTALLPTVRKALIAYRDQQDRAGERGSADCAALALDSLPEFPSGNKVE